MSTLHNTVTRASGRIKKPATAKQLAMMARRMPRRSEREHWRANDVACAHIVLSDPQLYGPGMCTWAEMVLSKDKGVFQF